MAYATANDLTNELAIADLEGIADLAEPTQDRLLRSAERTVADVAPPPPAELPIPQSYTVAARDAEIAVMDFMLTTQGGILKSSALSGVSSESFATLDAVRGIVLGVMGGQALGQPANEQDSSSDDVVSTFASYSDPRWAPYKLPTA